MMMSLNAVILSVAKNPVSRGARLFVLAESFATLRMTGLDLNDS